MRKSIFDYKKILFYGIGNHFKDCSKLFPNKEFILFDSNPNKWGEVIQNEDCDWLGGGRKTIILSPDQMLHYVDSETCVVISAINNQYEIAKKLVNNIGVSQDIVYAYTSEWYESKVYKSDVIAKNRNKVISISSKLADDDSKKYYKNSFIAREERNPLLLAPNPCCIKVGEYNDVVCLQKGDYIIDCGAYIGDSIEIYMDRLKGKCSIYAIEPFKNNYEAMLLKIKKHGWQKQIKTYQCAVGNKVGKALLTYDEDDSQIGINLSKKTGKSKQVITLETLDDLFEHQPVTYIKMDIEGEEAAALEGAQKIIHNYHPRLMISGYHKIEDFWEIPEMIWAMNTNYRIYVGHAPGVSTELEYYCIDE